jgi:hypothetical protein
VISILTRLIAALLDLTQSEELGGSAHREVPKMIRISCNRRRMTPALLIVSGLLLATFLLSSCAKRITVPTEDYDEIVNGRIVYVETFTGANYWVEDAYFRQGRLEGKHVDAGAISIKREAITLLQIQEELSWRRKVLLGTAVVAIPFAITWF